MPATSLNRVDCPPLPGMKAPPQIKNVNGHKTKAGPEFRTFELEDRPLREAAQRGRSTQTGAAKCCQGRHFFPFNQERIFK
jgi:hypothetical protein